MLIYYATFKFLNNAHISNASQALELSSMAQIAISAAATTDPPMAWPALAVEVDGLVEFVAGLVMGIWAEVAAVVVKVDGVHVLFDS